MTNELVRNVLAHIRSAVRLDAREVDLPHRLPGAVVVDAKEAIPVANGVIEGGVLKPHDPRFVNVFSTPCTYDPGATCRVWEQFLSFQMKPDCIKALQLWFGLCLVDDTSLQKMLVILGPTRSGKGTIERVLKELVGKARCAAPALQDFAESHGLEQLLETRVAIVSDARDVGQKRSHVLQELLKISGEDTSSINPKGIKRRQVRLRCRIMISANKDIDLFDETGALMARCIYLETLHDMTGREDHTLEGRILNELPGVLNWALQGLSELRSAGTITQPESAAGRVSEARQKQSNIFAWVDARCEIGTGHCVNKADAFADYESWVSDNKKGPTVTQNMLTRRLKEELGITGDKRDPQEKDGKRGYLYEGLKLLPKDNFKAVGQKQSRPVYGPPPSLYPIGYSRS